MRRMLRPVARQRVAEEIVVQLRGLIFRGVYAPGDKLPPERKLAEQLGVNRASLREAIKALEQLGLVKTRQGDGTRVLDYMSTAGLELISHLLIPNGQPDVEVLGDVLEFRRFFGREVARQAALRADADDLRRLAEVAARPAVDGDPASMLRLDLDFYVELTRVGRNCVFQLLINTIRGAVLDFAGFFAGLTASTTAVRAHHRELLDALERKDGERAAELSDAYLARGIEALRALVHEHPV